MAQVNGLFHARQKWSVIWSSYLCSTLSTTAPLPRPLKCSTCLCCCKLASTFQTCSVCRFRFSTLLIPWGNALAGQGSSKDRTAVISSPITRCTQHCTFSVLWRNNPPTPNCTQNRLRRGQKAQSQQRRVFGHGPGMFSITTRRSHISLAPPRS